jgi:diguanylate cyclase (GGDEF)-like protein
MSPERPDWATIGPRACVHALGVLDTAPDAVLDALAAAATAVAGVPVSVWLRASGGWSMVAPSGATVEWDREPTDDRRIDVVVGDAGLLAELRLGGDVARGASTALERLATTVAEALEARVARARRDERGELVGVLVVDGEATLRWWSADAGEVLGGPLDAWMGRPLTDMVPDDLRSIAAPLVARSLGGRGRSASVPVIVEVRPGEPVALDVQADSQLDDPEIGAVSFVIRRSAAPDDEFSLMGDQMLVLNRLANGSRLDDVLGHVVALLERQFPGSAVALHELEHEDGDGGGRARLRWRVAPLVDADVVAALDGLVASRSGPGSARAVAHELPDYTDDIRQDAGWAGLVEVTDRAGYRACWSIPVLSMAGRGTLGAIDVFRPVPGQPAVRETRVLLMAARLAALALDHDDQTAELTWRATHDPLTRLPNRTLFSERLVAATSAGPVAVVFVDLDRFKLVNDTLGHAFGDLLLQAVSGRLHAAVTAPSTVARFGGDEFTVLVPGVDDPEVALDVAHALLASIVGPYRIGEQTVTIGASAGVALGPVGIDDPAALVRDSDSALHHAKRRGRGRVELFDEALFAAASARVAVERDLREGLSGGLLHVAFQPVVRLSDGAVVGAEALARLSRPDGSAVSPADFIPVAEETGMIDALFDAVIAEACRVAVDCERADHPIIVWVNLSPVQLGDPDLLDRIGRALSFSQARPGHLGLEVTEQAILPDLDQATDRLSALAAAGLHLAVDDFGTGHSSLGYLQRLPVDTVKLDRSFVAPAAGDDRSRAIVTAVVELAAALGLRCVAEGVETASQLSAVAATGCDLAQGFHLARPERAADLLARLGS